MHNPNVVGLWLSLVVPLYNMEVTSFGITAGAWFQDDPVHQELLQVDVRPGDAGLRL